MTPTEKAEAAKQVLESPIFRQVYKDIRERFVVKMEDDASTEKAQLVALNLQLLKLMFSTVLQEYINELTMDRHRAKQDEFLAKTRETLT